MTNTNIDNLILVLKRIDSKGWCDATGGNFSVRELNGSIFITRSGVHKGYLLTEDFLEIDITGKPVSGNGKTSDETDIHLLIYSKDPLARMILHTHSPYGAAVSLKFKDQTSIAITGLEMQKAVANCVAHTETIQLPLFANDQDMKRLCRAIEERWSEVQKHQALYLVGHGLYVWGDSLRPAQRYLEGWEFLLHTWYLYTR